MKNFRILREALEQTKKNKDIPTDVFTETDVEYLINALGIQTEGDEAVCPKQLLKGINIEVEHSDLAPPNNAIIFFAKIALAHLRENPKYYTYLTKMEKEMDKKKK